MNESSNYAGSVAATSIGDSDAEIDFATTMTVAAQIRSAAGSVVDLMTPSDS
ncbi:hypothetical protein ACH47B_24655 [Rhodococcus sp. NPDC019627]|uniref:hypothetical protein n=1 Tax=unclassified Rhodococcus (in: high G+C Gram-positive bacteria) TaxID=192944 RepID=UPI0033DA4262